MYNPQLETFIQVVEAGSFNKAAEKLFISPPAVIKQINLLERSLNIELFIRTHRGLVLTEGGKSLYQDAKYIVQYCEDSVIRAKNAMSDESSILVVYFSMPETNRADNMTQEEDNSIAVIEGEVLGNTQYMVNVIQKQTGADIFRIEPETPYPVDHETLVDLAADEQKENARPAMKDSIENMDDYDVIYVGYPIWWSDMPMIMYTFFDEYDLSGKTIVPFGTHGGSQFARTPDTIAELEPSANVIGNSLTISRNDIQNAEDEIISWVNDLGF